MIFKSTILYCLMLFFFLVKSEDSIEDETVHDIWNELEVNNFVYFEKITSVFPDFAKKKINEWHKNKTSVSYMNYEKFNKIRKAFFEETDTEIQNLWEQMEQNGFNNLDKINSIIGSDVAKQKVKDWLKTNIKASRVDFERFKNMMKNTFVKDEGLQILRFMGVTGPTRVENPIEDVSVYYIWEEVAHDGFADFDTINSLFPEFARNKVKDWHKENTSEMSMNLVTFMRMFKDIFGGTDMEIQFLWVQIEHNGFTNLDQLTPEYISASAKQATKDWIKNNIKSISVNYETFLKMCKVNFEKSDTEINELWMKIEQKIRGFTDWDTIISMFDDDLVKHNTKKWAKENNITSSLNFIRFEKMMKSIFSKADGIAILRLMGYLVDSHSPIPIKVKKKLF